MHITGGCYCGALRYEVEAEPIFKGLCHCRECQYISGGQANTAIAMPMEKFNFTKGEPKVYRRTDLENPITRLFCAECGTHILSKGAVAPGLVIIKVGTMDDPSLFDKPDTAIWMCEAQKFHLVPEGVPLFEKFPPH